MITAVDTNVLLDVFLPDDQHGPDSLRKLSAAHDRGDIIVCDIVFAELVPSFGDRAMLESALEEIHATLSPINSSIAYQAGIRWMQYRRAGGPRTRIIADFLIGSHALASADTFLTRDRGFYDTYFPEFTDVE